LITHPLTNILLKVFARGFYRAHAGFLLFVMLVMVGAIPPERLWEYEKTLMLAFVTGPVMMMVVFAVWFIYAVKATVYVSGQLSVISQQFLFYSSNSLSRKKQFVSWFWMQFVVLLPLIAYGLIAVAVGLICGYYAAALSIAFYLLLLTGAGAAIYLKRVNSLAEGSKQSVLLKFSSKWRKPFFSLFVYHVFDKLKLTYIVTKTLSWLIITGVFYLFQDVRNDPRLAGIAVLSIIMAHSNIIYQEHKFENDWLAFARNMPFSRARRFFNHVFVYFILLLPEISWLFLRFNPAVACELLFAGLSVALLFHCLLYRLGLNMDKYLQWLLGLFAVVFWLIMYNLLLLLIPLNLALAYLMFYRKYYSYDQ
jgi:hypothetical protein